MAAQKQYADASFYESKLAKVMERLGSDTYNYDFSRHGCWVEFRYKGELYRFDHSVEKARSKGIELRYGSDAFAQVVLALEDLARMVERGIYDLSTWVAGMKFLPPVIEVPSFLKFMGFSRIPESVEEIRDRYKALAKSLHPDSGGSEEDFVKLQQASEQAIKFITQQ